MSRRSDTLPTWRALGAALTAFCLGIQLLVSGLSMGGMVRAAADADLAADLAVICTHDGTADPASGTPDPQKPHELCPACTCAQWHPLASPLPQPPLFAVLFGRSEQLPVRQAAADAGYPVHAPYASRAPPLSA
jgi:hypothetical protein